MRNPTEVLSTDDLEKALEKVKPDGLSAYLDANRDALMPGPHPFRDYMNERLKAKGLLKQTVILAADLPEKYGYRLLNEEKRTEKRDVYLRLFLAAHLSLHEAQRALRLAGQEELYARIPRDAALILAFNEQLGVDDLNELLLSNGFEALAPCGQNE